MSGLIDTPKSMVTVLMYLPWFGTLLSINMPQLRSSLLLEICSLKNNFVCFSKSAIHSHELKFKRFPQYPVKASLFHLCSRTQFSSRKNQYYWFLMCPYRDVLDTYKHLHIFLFLSFYVMVGCYTHGSVVCFFYLMCLGECSIFQLISSFTLFLSCLCGKGIHS